MKYAFYIVLLLAPLLLRSQAGESTKEEKVLSETEINMLKLAEQLQNGLAKLRAGEKAGDQETMLSACLELASLYEQEHYYEKAIPYFEQAVGLSNELGRHEQRLDIQSRLAKALFENNQLEDAFESCLELFEQHQIFGMYEPAIQDLELLAVTCNHLNNHVKAREFYVKIMELATLTGDQGVAVTAMNNMGFSAANLENYKEAVHYFTQAEEMANRNAAEIPAYVFTNLGIAWNNLGDQTRSMANLHKAEEKETANKSYVEHLISSIYLNSDDIYNALAHNELAIKSAKKTNQVQVMADAY